MQPAARLAAAIEVLDEAISSARGGGAAAAVSFIRVLCLPARCDRRG